MSDSYILLDKWVCNLQHWCSSHECYAYLLLTLYNTIDNRRKKGLICFETSEPIILLGQLQEMKEVFEVFFQGILDANGIYNIL